MELRQLRYFVAIADHGSLSRAALVLHVAQPALTQQVRQLEEELGAQLLHRSAQGVLCTDAGKVFYEHAQAILKQVADARSAVTQSTTRPAGSVTLGFPHSISGALALPLLTATRARYPEITLQLTEELSGSLAEQLISGAIRIVASRSRRFSMVRVAMMPGTAQANDDSSGMNDLPLRPTPAMRRSIKNAARAI